MKSIAIIRHAATEGPGYLAEFLDRKKIPWQLIRVDAGDAVPKAASVHSGLVFMGGPMSVNDDLPWIRDVLSLIRDAHAQDIPLLGHCLGGQLISKALGGVVTRNPVKEIGWGVVTVQDNAVARDWFGDLSEFQAFHWHGETFSLPQGAIHILSSRYCANQGYVLGRHLALQCHVEMTSELIDTWCVSGADEVSASTSPAVMSVGEIRKRMADELPRLQAVAGRLYSKWIDGLRP